MTPNQPVFFTLVSGGGSISSGGTPASATGVASATYFAPAATTTATIYVGSGQGSAIYGQIQLPVSCGSTSIYCQVGTTNYNAALCAQYGGTAAPGVTWISVSPAVLTCGQTAQITALPPGIVSGALVTFSASQGVVTPSATTFFGNLASATYQAPATATSNIVTITVSTGSTSGSKQVTLNCGNTASTITLSAVPTNLNCGASSFVTAITNSPGSTVNLTTTVGTISPVTAVDQGGGVLAVLTAPQSGGGVATVRATSGNASGQTTVTISCTAATAVPAARPATPVPAPPVVAPIIQPPNTGDGGLLR